jgi:sulfur-carrier protein
MSKYKLKAFGITKEIVGSRDIEFVGMIQTVADLRMALKERYPELATLKSLMIAINNEYAGDDQLVREEDEIALIPPVSGG